jgi:HK97 family phage portal protein
MTRNVTYDVTNTQTGDQATYTLITDGGPGMYAGWGDGEYRGGMGIPAAWRLALLIANQLGRVPFDAYRQLADRPAVQLPDQPFLTMPAGTTDTKLSVYRSWGLDRLWHGNAIGVIVAWSPLGYPTAATPVSAENVQVQRFGAQLPYPGQNWIPPGFESGEVGYLIGGTWYHAYEIVHFKGPCKPGALRGMGVLENHFELLSRSRKLGAAATAVDAGAVPTGLLRSLNPDMSPTEAQELKDSWRNSQRERTVAVLNPLTEFTPIAWNPTETQLLESRQYDVVDWANVFGVSASYAGGTNPSRVYANIEDQGLDLLKYGTPGDIVAEFEAVLSMMMPRGQYVKANLDHLLRADTKTRYEAHSIAIAAGFLTRNEVREFEERQPFTPEQEREVAEATARGPSGSTGPGGGPNTASNQPGTGKAPPRLAAVRSLLERGALPEDVSELEPDYDGPDTWPDRTWFPGEAEAWAADDAGLSVGAAAGGLDVGARAQAGADALHRYWTAGPGLARWRGSPHPWSTLHAFLSKYLSGERLDATTSAWYRDVFGHLPNQGKGRQHRAQARWPRGSGDKSGEWMDGPGGRGLGAQAPPLKRGAYRLTYRPDPRFPLGDGNRAAQQYGQEMSGRVTRKEWLSTADYVQNDFTAMNGYLRTGSGSGSTKARVEAMDGLMGKYRLPAEARSLRGVHNDPAIPPPGQAVGKVVTSQGFQSTTMALEDEEHFLGGTILDITVPKGSNAILANGLGVSRWPEEQELILPHGTRYAIRSDTMKGGQRWLKVTAMPPA